MSPHIVSPQIREICLDGITFSSQVQSSSHWFSLLGSNKHFAGNPLKHYKKRKKKVIMILFIFCLNHETFFFTVWDMFWTLSTEEGDIQETVVYKNEYVSTPEVYEISSSAFSMLIICQKMETLCLPCSLQPQCQLKSITLPTFCKMNHRIINLNMCIAMKRGQKLTLLPCLHLTTLTTSRNKQWNTNLIQIFKNCRKLKANPFPCQQLWILCYTWLINCVINMTVVFGQWPFDIHLCFCFVRKH